MKKLSNPTSKNSASKLMLRAVKVRELQALDEVTLRAAQGGIGPDGPCEHTKAKTSTDIC